MIIYFTLVPEDNQVVVIEPDDPSPAAQEDIDSSVQLRFPDFQIVQVWYEYSLLAVLNQLIIMNNDCLK